MLQVISGKPKEVLDKSAVGCIEKEISRISKEKNVVILALPGGRSVQGILSLLKTARIDWSKIHMFLADDRRVPITDTQSNYHLLYTTLIKSLLY